MRKQYRGLLPVVPALVLMLAVSLPSSSVRAGSGIRDGDWSGWLQLPRNTVQVRLDLQLHGSTAVVSLGAGHASAQTVAVQRSGTSLRFALPGVPSPIKASLQLRAGKLSGSARQGSTIGRLQLTSSGPTVARFLGSYRLANGDIVTISDYRRLGLPIWFENMGTDELRGLYRLSSTQYAIGSGESVRDPSAGSIRFVRDGSSLTESLPGKSDVQAARISFRQQEVRFANGKVTLAGTLTFPAGAGPFPAVVMVHGAGASQRDEEQNFVGFLAVHGIASLAVDKRGEGQSGGQYPGDLATDFLVRTLAGDAEAAGRFLVTQSAIDPKRIGLFGGSQAGWIIPLAAAEARTTFSFAVILSGPVVSQGESDYYASLTDQGNSTPSLSPDEIDAMVHAHGSSGFDPRPSLQTLRIPILWIYGDKDQNQPTRLDIPVLQELKATTGADFSWVILKDSNHGLSRTPTGLNSEAAASPGFAPGFFAAMESWLRAHSLAS